jgi:hypothetical protein
MMNVIQTDEHKDEAGSNPLQQHFEIYQNGTQHQTPNKGKNNPLEMQN